MKGYLCVVFVALTIAVASSTGSSAQPTTSNPPTKAAPTQNVGVVYFTPYRVKFSDQMYIGMYCVLADGQTATDIAAVLGAAGSLAGTITTGATATLLKSNDAVTTALKAIVNLAALHPGEAYCYHLKFADDNHQDIKFVYSIMTPASSNFTVAFATNSYMKRYTATGVVNSTFVMNNNDDLLGIEYPQCGTNNCPCRGQFCQVHSFGQLPTNDTIVAVSFCVEAPANTPTESFIISFGAPEKITNPTKRPIPTDDPPLTPPNYSTVGAVAKSCAQRGFM